MAWNKVLVLCFRPEYMIGALENLHCAPIGLVQVGSYLYTWDGILWTCLSSGQAWAWNFCFHPNLGCPDMAHWLLNLMVFCFASREMLAAPWVGGSWLHVLPAQIVSCMGPCSSSFFFLWPRVGVRGFSKDFSLLVILALSNVIYWSIIIPWTPLFSILLSYDAQILSSFELNAKVEVLGSWYVISVRHLPH